MTPLSNPRKSKSRARRKPWRCQCGTLQYAESAVCDTCADTYPGTCFAKGPMAGWCTRAANHAGRHSDGAFTWTKPYPRPHEQTIGRDNQFDYE